MPEQHLRDSGAFANLQLQRSGFSLDNMFFASNVVASYIRDIRPSASLFSLIKFRLGGHSLRVETDR